MPELTVVTAFALLWAVIVPTPGPNSLMVTHLALTRPWSHVGVAIAANMTAIVLIALCALFGMAAVLVAFPWLKLAVHVLGGVYLIYFGVRLWLRRDGSSTQQGNSEAYPTDRSPYLTSASRGFATGLSNAQAVVFITSIFAASGVLNASLVTGLACVGVMIVMNVSYLSFLGWIFLKPAPRRVYERFRTVIEKLIGTLFVVFGVRLIVRQLAGD